LTRITTLAAALAAIVAMSIGATPANAAFCSTSSAGGEKIPAITSTDISETGSQGYTCTTAWDADVQPQYETGGTWVYCVECAPGFHPNTPDQFWPANSPFSWPHTYGVHNVEGLVSWTPSATGDTPVCHFNWRLQVNFFGTNHYVFQSDVSPTLHKTC
jgi:uncharacterized membrane protein